MSGEDNLPASFVRQLTVSKVDISENVIASVAELLDRTATCLSDTDSDDFDVERDKSSDHSNSRSISDVLNAALLSEYNNHEKDSAGELNTAMVVLLRSWKDNGVEVNDKKYTFESSYIDRLLKAFNIQGSGYLGLARNIENVVREINDEIDSQRGKPAGLKA